MIDKERMKQQIDELGDGMMLFAAETENGEGLNLSVQGKGGELLAAVGTIISELADQAGTEPGTILRHLALGLLGVDRMSKKELGAMAIEFALMAGIADMPMPKGGVN